MIVLQHRVVTAVRVSIWFTTISVSVNYPTLAGIAMPNWTLAPPTSARMGPNAHRLATTWISRVLANWATLAVYVTRTSTNAPSRRHVAMAPHVKTPTVHTFAYVLKATKVAIV